MPIVTRSYPIVAADGSIKMITEQIDEPQSEINHADLLAKATTALNNNATFLAVNSPTTAQTLTQVQSLTRQVNVIIRLLTGQLDTTTNT